MKNKFFLPLLVLLVGVMTFIAACDQTPESSVYMGNFNIPAYNDTVNNPDGDFQIFYTFDTLQRDSDRLEIAIMFDSAAVWTLSNKATGWNFWVKKYEGNPTYETDILISDTVTFGFQKDKWYHFYGADINWDYDRTCYVEFTLDSLRSFNGPAVYHLE